MVRLALFYPYMTKDDQKNFYFNVSEKFETVVDSKRTTMFNKHAVEEKENSDSSKKT